MKKEFKLTLLFVYLLLFSFIFAGFSLASSFSFSPKIANYTEGKIFKIEVAIDTEGIKISGADLKINFDSSKLELIDITAGKIFSKYLGEKIDNQSGKASISAIAASAQKLFSGKSSFANLRFKAKSAGLAQISVIYQAGSSNDSNIADFENQKDSLEKGEEINILITNKNSNLKTPLTGEVKGTKTTAKNNSPLFLIILLPFITIIAIIILSKIIKKLLSRKKSS